MISAEKGTRIANPGHVYCMKNSKPQTDINQSICSNWYINYR